MALTVASAMPRYRQAVNDEMLHSLSLIYHIFPLSAVSVEHWFELIDRRVCLNLPLEAITLAHYGSLLVRFERCPELSSVTENVQIAANNKRRPL